MIEKLNKISDLLNDAFIVACQIEDENPEAMGISHIKGAICELLLDVELTIIREKGESENDK